MAARNVTASINSKGDIYYIIIGYYVGDTRKQKWIKTDLTVSGNNKRKIEQRRLELLREWQDKATLNDNQLLFSDFLMKWLDETKHTISENTYFSYRGTVHNVICPYFADKKIKLCDLKPFHIQDFYTFKLSNGVTANTIHHYQANIHKALSYAVKTERLKSNPADKVELPKKQKHIPVFYSTSELKNLLEYVKQTKIEPVVYLAAWFGLRRGEIIGLRWCDIDFDSKILYIRGTMTDKGASGSKLLNTHYVASAKTAASIRSFPMSDSTVEYLQKLKAEQDKRKGRVIRYNHKWDEFICVRDNGDIIPLEYVSRVFPQLCLKAGLKRLRLHELRHTNISLLIEAGASMKEVQEWAGHSSYNTTANIYAHIQAKTKSRLTQSLETMLLETC